MAIERFHGYSKPYWLLERFVSTDGRERGKVNEDRAFILLTEMVKEGTLVRASRASKRQRLRKGIDMFAVVSSQTSEGLQEEVRVPLQIKSSNLQGRIRIAENQRKTGEHRIIVVVVNEGRSDDVIRSVIQENVGLFLKSPDHFRQSRV